jgi:uncharacterized protein
MLIHELTPAECREVVARASLGRLACARHDQPYVVPIQLSYDLESESLYAFSTVGQKIEWMRANPKVCVEIDEIADKLHWTTVLVFGTYEEIQHSTQPRKAEATALELFRQRSEWWLPAASKVVGKPEHHMPVVYRIRIGATTGRVTGRS